MFNATRPLWVYAPLQLKLLGGITAQQFTTLENSRSSTDSRSRPQIFKMTRKIPPETTAVRPTSFTSALPTTCSSRIRRHQRSIRMVDGAMDLSPAGLTACNRTSTCTSGHHKRHSFQQNDDHDMNDIMTTEYSIISSPAETPTKQSSFITKSEPPYDTSFATLFLDNDYICKQINDFNSQVDTELKSPESVLSSSSSFLSNSHDFHDIFGDDEAAFDPSVKKAALDAAHMGVVTPLIKEELKCKIQSKRLMKGEDELVIDLSVKEKDELSEEDLAKRLRRRERNKIAAQKCRDKRKEKADSLVEETQKLESSNSQLRRQIKQLEVEKEKLMLLLKCHDTSFHNCPANQRLSTGTADNLSVSNQSSVSTAYAEIPSPSVESLSHKTAIDQGNCYNFSDTMDVFDDEDVIFDDATMADVVVTTNN